MGGGIDASNDRVDGPVGTGFYFDGVNDFAIASSSDYTSNNATVSLWFKAVSTGGNRMLFNNYDGPSNEWGFGLSGSNLRLSSDIGGDGQALYDTPIIVGQWYHVAAIQDNLENKLYLNGALVGSGASSTSSWSNLSVGSIHIGAKRGNWQFFDGDIDDVQIYSRGLTESEILELYNAGDIPIEGSYDLNDGLLGYWKMDETSGTAIIDSTGNGNDGTLQYNNAGFSDGRVDGSRDFYDASRFNIPNGISNLGNMRNISISFWANFDEMSGYEQILSAPDFAYIDNSDFNHNDFRFVAGNWGTTIGRFEVNDGFANIGKWQHYTVTYSYDDPVGTQPKMYIDGVAQTVTTSTTPAGVFETATGTEFYFGRNSSSSSSGMDGKLDDFRIYNRVLSPSEVEILNGCTGPGSYYYNFSDDTMQWCSGVASAYNMGPTDVGGNTTCTMGGDPFTVSQGNMHYRPGSETMYFCNGDYPIPIGRQCTNCGGSPSEKVAFVEYDQISAQFLGGIVSANARCQAAANAAGLQGTYYAWLADSDPNSAPATRFSSDIRSGTYAIVMPNGTQIAADWSDLTDGNISNNLSVTEFGSSLISHVDGNMITNVNSDRTQFASTGTCSDYTSGSEPVRRGDSRQSDGRWTSSGTVGCNAGAHIYCFEQ